MTESGRYTREMHEEYRKKQDEAERKEREERQERYERETARRAWLGDGGAEADFEREWPKLRDEARRQRVMDADTQARERQRMSRVSRI